MVADFKDWDNKVTLINIITKAKTIMEEITLVTFISLTIAGILLISLPRLDGANEKYKTGYVFCIIGILGLIFMKLDFINITVSTHTIMKMEPSLLTAGQFPFLAALITSTLTLIVINGRYIDRFVEIDKDKARNKWDERAHKQYAQGYKALNYVIIIQMVIVSLLLIRISVAVLFNIEVPLFDKGLICLTLATLGIGWPVFFYWITSFQKTHDLHEITNIYIKKSKQP